VVDAPQSAAARQGFTDQLGVITASFHVALPKGAAQKSLGTALGREYDIQTRCYDDVEPGNMLAVIHVRYVSPEELDRLRGR